MTGLIWHELYTWHDTGNMGGPEGKRGQIQPVPHVEHPESKRRFRGLLETSGLLEHLSLLKPKPATPTDLLRFHTPQHIAHIQKLSDGGGGMAGIQAPMGPGSYEIALLSTGGCMVAVDGVMQGQVQNAYALVRPPGHHAEKDRAFGFCLFANIVVAAKYAQATYGLKRIAVVDYDVHHGNGTEQAFYSDPSALTISVHQENCFPLDSGALQDNGQGEGTGSNLNIPLPPGSGHPAYLAAFEQVIIPALHAYQPELILVASGFDASAFDPLGQMMCHSETYRSIAGQLKQAAQTLCGGRIVFCHEGGYSQHYVPFCGLAVVEVLSGIRSEVEDPFLKALSRRGGQTLQPHQAEVVGRAAGLLRNIPRP
jgi:acetoin utilization deacetylase AcuC-like enzyme